ncbi:outer membrane beta-barrel protein [Beijerinckia sp. L45]|uniref:outer membrane beta-barrel protein n=1 Tax=Beijerinckia sp. L45 TaxID=1641855 RepID=UPI00131CD6B2|nr:outer membrane beta-barrel protein [Beijerinckia sp. L45]
MPFRSSRSFALCLAATLAVACAAPVQAQTVDLRGGDDATGSSFATATSPDTVTPQPVPPLPTDADAAAAPITPAVPDPNATNYGKPRPKKAKLYRPNAKTSPPLPALVPYRGAPGLPKGQLNPPAVAKDAVDPAQPAPTTAAIPRPEQPRKPVVEDDPFAPTGVAAGPLRLFPFVETSGGYETNPNQTTTSVKASSVLRGEAGLDVKSDFSAHSLTASLRGGYTDYPSNTDASRPDASGVVDGRIDVTRDDKIDLEGRFSLATQTPGSPLLAVPGSVFITNRPTIVSEGATVGATHTFNRLSLGLRSTFDRTEYGDATQSDGSQFLFSQDNYNDYGIIGRAAYELTPALIPFTEVGFDARVRDHTLDLSGFARSSKGITARVGSTFEFSRLLTGTVSGGYADRHYDDPRLADLRGPTFDAALVYAYSPITTVTLRGSTILAETTLAGSSGAITRSVSLELSHVFFRNFTLGGIGTYQVNQYQGLPVNEVYTQGTIKAAYSLTRDVQIIASATRQRLDSSLQNSSYNDNIFLLGMRLQR